MTYSLQRKQTSSTITITARGKSTDGQLCSSIRRYGNAGARRANHQATDSTSFRLSFRGAGQTQDSQSQCKSSRAQAAKKGAATRCRESLKPSDHRSIRPLGSLFRFVSEGFQFVDKRLLTTFWQQTLGASLVRHPPETEFDTMDFATFCDPAVSAGSNSELLQEFFVVSEIFSSLGE